MNKAQKNEKSLAGKTAVITGSTRGFGLAIARAYALAGARVVVASRSQASVDQAIESLRQAGGEASGITCDAGNAIRWRHWPNMPHKPTEALTYG